MLTKTETRIIYLLLKAGGSLRHFRLSQAMSRLPAKDRDRALQTLEVEFGLISSAATPSAKGKGRGGAPGLTYWLTDEGTATAEELISTGKMKDPRVTARVAPCAP